MRSWLDSFRFLGVLRAAPCVVCLGLLLPASGCDADRAQAVRTLKSGLKKYKRGETGKAVELMEKAAETDADFVKPHYQAGQIYEIDLDEPKKAERHYQQALQLSSKDEDRAKFGYALGRVLITQSEYEDAISALKKAVEADKTHAKAWFRMGIAQQKMGRNAEAVESFMEAIRANPRMRMDDEDPGGAHYHALGGLYVEYGFYDKALDVYENGVTNNPKSPRLYQGRGVAQLELERYDAAAESFQKALDLQDESGTALFNLAVAREESGDLEGARDALEKFLNETDRGENRARVAAAQGKMQEIEDKLEKE